MKIQIFIETAEGAILIDRSYLVRDGNAPQIDMQDLVDDAIKYKEQRDKELVDEANILVRNDLADF